MGNIFSPFGAIPSNGIKVLLTDTGECRGIGFVNFLEPEPAQNALNTLNGTMLPSGKVLFIQPNSQGSKGASGGKKGGGGNSTENCKWCKLGECWDHPGGKSGGKG